MSVFLIVYAIGVVVGLFISGYIHERSGFIQRDYDHILVAIFWPAALIFAAIFGALAAVIKTGEVIARWAE